MEDKIHVSIEDIIHQGMEDYCLVPIIGTVGRGLCSRRVERFMHEKAAGAEPLDGNYGRLCT